MRGAADVLERGCGFLIEGALTFEAMRGALTFANVDVCTGIRWQG